MRYNPLGRTGLFVSELCLGTMTFGGEGFFGYIGQVRQDEADALLRAAIDAGVNFIDTANVYSHGLSEEITGQAIRNLGLQREDIVLATKVMGPMGEGPNEPAAIRAAIIMDQVKASLNRLGTDHIDLYQIHGFDAATPIEETVRALDDLVRQGHVRYVGVSNWAAWQIAKALGIAERLGLSRFQSVQSYYTLAGRDLEREIVPMMHVRRPRPDGVEPARRRLSVGQISRRRGRGAPRRPAPSRRSTRRAATTVLDAMRRRSPGRRAYRSRRSRSPGCCTSRVVTSVIVGAKRQDQLDDNLGAVAGRAERGRAARRSMRPARCRRNIPAGCSALQGSYRDGRDRSRRGARAELRLMYSNVYIRIHEQDERSSRPGSTRTLAERLDALAAIQERSRHGSSSQGDRTLCR